MILGWETGWIIPPSGDGWILHLLVDGMDNTFVGRWIDTVFVGGQDESELLEGTHTSSSEGDGMGDTFVWGQCE